MAYRDVILAEAALQSYWEMDEASGNIADSEGAVTGTTLGNNTYAQTGLIPTGSSILIDPGSDAGACGFAMGDVYGFTGVAAFSVEAWVKPNILDATNRMIACKEDASGLNYGWYVAYHSTNVQVRRRDATINNSPNFAHTMSVGGVYHIVATFDGADIKAYQDGAQIGTTQGSTASLLSHTDPFRIGSHSEAGNRLRGTADEVAIYNAALSAASVLAHYNAGITLLGRRYMRFVGPAQLGSSAADLYTVPTGARATLRNVYVSNPSGAEIEFTLSVGTDAAGTRLLDQHAVPANDSYASRRATHHALEAGEKIQGFADVATTAVVVIDGYLESL